MRSAQSPLVPIVTCFLTPRLAMMCGFSGAMVAGPREGPVGAGDVDRPEAVTVALGRASPVHPPGPGQECGSRKVPRDDRSDRPQGRAVSGAAGTGHGERTPTMLVAWGKPDLLSARQPPRRPHPRGRPPPLQRLASLASPLPSPAGCTRALLGTQPWGHLAHDCSRGRSRRLPGLRGGWGPPVTHHGCHSAAVAARSLIPTV